MELYPVPPGLTLTDSGVEAACETSNHDAAPEASVKVTPSLVVTKLTASLSGSLV